MFLERALWHCELAICVTTFHMTRGACGFDQRYLGRMPGGSYVCTNASTRAAEPVVKVVMWVFYQHAPAYDGDEERVREFVEDMVMSVPCPKGVSVHPLMDRVCFLCALVFLPSVR